MSKEFKEVYSELIDYAKELGLSREEINEFVQENEWLLCMIRKTIKEVAN
ncbi:hypothetical protein EYB33_19880 [Lysinibacillus sphaericus]|nr:hypothetical protein [Lysinibacillus sphaericus]UDK98388.1 hypothetical protein EYB33_19880 [Lysinibacillus sphaericus]